MSIQDVVYARCVSIHSNVNGETFVDVWPPIFVHGLTGDDLRSLVLDQSVDSLPVVGRFYSFSLDADRRIIGYERFP